MKFNAKDDFVNEIELQEEKELLEAESQATEEDNGFDNHYVHNEPSKDWKDLKECNPDHNDIDENFGDEKPEIEGEEE
jgi:hypothetical protein